MNKPLERLETGYLVNVFKASDPRRPIANLHVVRITEKFAYLNDGTCMSRSLGMGTDYQGVASVFPVGSFRDLASDNGLSYKLVPNAEPLPPFSVNPQFLDPRQVVRAVSIERGEEGDILTSSAHPHYKHLTNAEFVRHLHENPKSHHAYQIELMPQF